MEQFLRSLPTQPGKQVFVFCLWLSNVAYDHSSDAGECLRPNIALHQVTSEIVADDDGHNIMETVELQI